GLKGEDPLAALFTWFSYVSAVGILLLMFGTSIACAVYLNRFGDQETVWQKTVAPVLATILLGVILYVTAANANTLLGTAKGSSLEAILPGVVAAALVVGVLWGALLKFINVPVYEGIGNGGPSDELLA